MPFWTIIINIFFLFDKFSHKKQEKNYLAIQILQRRQKKTTKYW